MNEKNNYLEINRKLWNAKTKVHVNSDFYNNDLFLKTKQSLNPIELELLGDISGKSILHLQCHFGQDSISLANLGAQVTAIDISDEAIKEAKGISQKLNVDVNFICTNIYDLPKVLENKFDFVFTSYGTIGWLPDLNKWADIIEKYLKTTGEFIMVEFHPFLWMFDDLFSKIEFDYFNTSAIIEEIKGTYADFNSAILNKSVSWNHPISEVLSSLINKNLIVTHFEEYDYSPYPCFKNVSETEKGKFRIQNFGNKIPMLYSLKAKRL